MAEACIMAVQLETLSQSQGVRRNTVEFVGVTDGELTVITVHPNLLLVFFTFMAR